MQDAFEIYSRPGFARRYAGNIAGLDRPEFYDRRALLELLPPLNQQRVLDAGCGPGAYTGWLLAQGARLTSLDYSPAMLELLPAGCIKVRADLREPLPLATGTFDLILCAMVLQHLADWRPVLTEFRRLLADTGRLVLSTTHPLTDWPPAANYFAVTATAEAWPEYGVEMPSFRRSLGRIWQDLRAAGFRLDELREPQAPGRDSFITHQPWVLCLRLKPELIQGANP